MPHFECGAFNHSATSPEGAIVGAWPLWLGALIGEDGGPDKAGGTKSGRFFVWERGCCGCDGSSPQIRRGFWHRKLVMPRPVPPARSKPLRRGEGPGIHGLCIRVRERGWPGRSPAMTPRKHPAQFDEAICDCTEKSQKGGTARRGKHWRSRAAHYNAGQEGRLRRPA